MPRPTASDRRVGAARTSQARGCSRGQLTRHGSVTASARATDRGKRAFAATVRSSSPERPLLQVGQRELAEKLDLVLEPDLELLVSAAPGLGHQSQSIGRGRAVGILDEVRVLR